MSISGKDTGKTAGEKMQAPKAASHAADRFDPFCDRRSRDIRNSLSQAFIQAIAENDPSPVTAAAKACLDQNPAQIYRDYISQRLECYLRVLQRIAAAEPNDPRLQAVIIWNEGLFFEVHEHLENLWQRAAGCEREALKGFIQAAGFFVHVQRGHLAGAQRLAAKSAALIRRWSEQLTFIGNLDALLACLDSINPVAPHLEFCAADDPSGS